MLVQATAKDKITVGIRCLVESDTIIRWEYGN